MRSRAARGFTFLFHGSESQWIWEDIAAPLLDGIGGGLLYRHIWSERKAEQGLRTESAEARA